MNTKSYYKLLLKIIISVGLFGFLYTKVDFNDVGNKFLAMNPNYIPVIVLLISLNYVISSIRWQKLIEAQGTFKVSLKYLISLYFTGSFFNNFMPTSIGGDVYKIIKLGKRINNNAVALTATFMERFLGVLALGCIALIGSVKLYGYIAILVLVLFIVLSILGFIFIKVIAKKLKFVQKVLDSLMAYKNHSNTLVFAFTYSFLVQLLAIFSQYFVFISLQVYPPILYAFFVLPVITLAGFFIPSLNGIGVQDALYVSLFAVVGISSEIAITASILYHLIRLAVSLFGGVLYVLGYDD